MGRIKRMASVKVFAVFAYLEHTNRIITKQIT